MESKEEKNTLNQAILLRLLIYRNQPLDTKNIKSIKGKELKLQMNFILRYRW